MSSKLVKKKKSVVPPLPDLQKAKDGKRYTDLTPEPAKKYATLHFVDDGFGNFQLTWLFGDPKDKTTDCFDAHSMSHKFALKCKQFVDIVLDVKKPIEEPLDVAKPQTEADQLDEASNVIVKPRLVN